MELILIVFTVGYLIQHIASFVLIWQIKKKLSLEGLSKETQILYMIGAIARCFWVFDTRLMYFPLIWIELLLSLVFSGYILYLFYKYSHTILTQIDNPFSYKLLIIVCSILAFFLHPGLKGKYYFTIQMLVSFSMFLEASGLLPQLYLARKAGSVDVNIGHYIILLAVSRVFRLIFWLMMYYEGDHFVYLIAADLLHSFFVGDFVFYYLKRKSGNTILLS